MEVYLYIPMRLRGVVLNYTKEQLLLSSIDALHSDSDVTETSSYVYSRILAAKLLSTSRKPQPFPEDSEG